MKISIDDIKNAKEQSLITHFENEVDGLCTDGNVCADLVFSAYSSFIGVKGKIVANVKLVCDRCLKDFVEKIEV